MKNEVLIDESYQGYIKVFYSEIETISPKIQKLLEDKNITIKLVNNVYDIKTKEEENKNYDKFYSQKYAEQVKKSFPTRGIMSDEKICIAIFKDNTDITNIGAILYHEIGHFLDAYKNFGNINSLADLEFSSNPEFVEAYTKDFVANWDKIKTDTNFRLKHFIQDSTPEKIVKSGITESFAEIFRFLNKKVIDAKTVELYFPTAIEVEKKLLTEKYQLSLPS